MSTPARQHTTTETAQAPTITPFWARPRFVFGAILLYLALHFTLRMIMVPTLGIDDAEQALFSQQLELSYRYRAPPLFTWLLIGLTEFLPISILPISILRYGLLAAIAGFFYASSRLLLRDDVLAALATYSLATVYVIGYFSHHDLTHTTMMTAGLAAAWYFALKLVERQTAMAYIGFGVACAVALLGKWSAVIFMAAVVLVALFTPRLRNTIVFNWRLGLAAFSTLAITGPVALSTYLNGPSPKDKLSNTLGVESGFSITESLTAAGNLTVSMLAYPQPFLIVFLICFARFFDRRSLTRLIAGDNGSRPLIAIATAVTVTAMMLFYLVAMATGAEKLPERLLQPALLMVPALAYATVDRANIPLRNLAQYAATLLFVMVLAFGARIGTYLVEPERCKACRMHVPVAALAQALQQQGFSGNGTIITHRHHLGGNLRVQFPEARIGAAQFAWRNWSSPPETRGDCLLIIDEFENRQAPAETLEALAAYAQTTLGADFSSGADRGQIVLPLYGSQTRERQYAFLLQRGGSGECR